MCDVSSSSWCSEEPLGHGVAGSLPQGSTGCENLRADPISSCSLAGGDFAQLSPDTER